MVDERPLGVVTGASSGIGFHLARELAERGYDLVIAADEPEIEDVAGQLRALTEVEAVRVDLRSPDEVRRLASQVGDGGRVPAALLLNAGSGVNGAFVETDLDVHLGVIALNVTGVVQLAGLVVPDMARRGVGRVMFTSSVASAAPGPFMSTYSASKAFVQSFAQALRHELEPTGVTVTALMPGPTDTDFFARSEMEEDTTLGRMPKDDAAEVARDGVEGMLEGKDHVIAGSLLNRLSVAGAAVTPERVRAALHAQLTEPDG